MSLTPNNFSVVELPLSQVNSDLTRCPKCSGTHVVIEGDFLRHYQEEFQEGKSVKIDLGDRCKLAARISCSNCRITFLLVPDNIYNEKHDNMKIRIELAKRDGLLGQLDQTKPPVIQ